MKPLNEIRYSLSLKERTFPEKGANRECYNTIMLYEVNDYIEESFCNGFNSGSQAMLERVLCLLRSEDAMQGSDLCTGEDYAEFLENKLNEENRE